MTDEELRRRIAEAHRDDAPPPFAALVARKRRRRWRLALAPIALAAAALLALLLVRPPRPRPQPPSPSLYVDSRGPLDFLLQTPGGELLRDTPHLHTEGAIP